MISGFLIPGDITRDHVVEEVSAEFLPCKATVFPSVLDNATVHFVSILQWRFSICLIPSTCINEHSSVRKHFSFFAVYSLLYLFISTGIQEYSFSFGL